MPPSLHLNINNFFGMDGLVVLVVGILIFGRRLSNAAHNLKQEYSQSRPADPHLDPRHTILSRWLLAAILIILFILVLSKQ